MRNIRNEFLNRTSENPNKKTSKLLRKVSKNYISRSVCVFEKSKQLPSQKKKESKNVKLSQLHPTQPTWYGPV